jgi:nicotinamide mononucleotide transporter
MFALELVAVAFAVAYLVLAIRQSIWCWPAAIVSVIASFVVFRDARLLMEAALQVFYLGMALFGWYQWLRGGSSGEGVQVHWWPLQRHLAALALIAVLTALFGRVLVGTDAALPYLDSFTTVAAIVTTWMVARKIIENWIYWFVIDSVSIYLYLDRGLVYYAGLFVVYLVLVVIGFRAWLAGSRSGPVGA